MKQVASAYSPTIVEYLKYGASIIHVPRGQSRGRRVHEMTMNDHVVTWTEIFLSNYCIVIIENSPMSSTVGE